MDGYQLCNIQIDDSLKEKTFSYIEKLYNSNPSVEEYAFMYERSLNFGFGCKLNNDTAIKIYTQLAEQGYADAQYNLYVCYYDGKGVTQDYMKAVYWCTKAAEQCNENAKEVSKSIKKIIADKK